MKKNTFSLRPPPLKESTCQYELDVHYSGIEAMQPTGEWQKLPPLRLLSFGGRLSRNDSASVRRLLPSVNTGVETAASLGAADIECVKLHGQGFPSAEADPVIQISSLLQVHGQRAKDKDSDESKDANAKTNIEGSGAPSASDSDGVVAKVLFSLHECAPIAGAVVLWFDEESEMLAKWSEFVREVKGLSPPTRLGPSGVAVGPAQGLGARRARGRSGGPRLSDWLQLH